MYNLLIDADNYVVKVLDDYKIVDNNILEIIEGEEICYYPKSCGFRIKEVEKLPEDIKNVPYFYENGEFIKNEKILQLTAEEAQERLMMELIEQGVI